MKILRITAQDVYKRQDYFHIEDHGGGRYPRDEGDLDAPG